jgi:murein DD-endopeptidase MepM/ murein hydrolase activator NlpD
MTTTNNTPGAPETVGNAASNVSNATSNAAGSAGNTVSNVTPPANEAAATAANAANAASATATSQPAPAPVAAGNAIVDPKPLKKFVYPFPGLTQTAQTGAQQTTFEIIDALRYLRAWAEVGDGFYPLGINGQFHGGIHFDGVTGGILAQRLGIRCIADGEVIAYRINEKYPETNYTPTASSTSPSPVSPLNYNAGSATFSSGFVRVRHRLQIPKELMQAGAAPAPAAAPVAPAVNNSLFNLGYPVAEPRKIVVTAANGNRGYFGWVRNGGNRPHQGWDFRAEIGTEVLASGDGEVIDLPDSDSYGKTLLIKHRADLYTFYAHLSAKTVTSGHVSKGDTIARSGISGNAGSAQGVNGSLRHLHFEIRTDHPIVNRGLDDDFKPGYQTDIRMPEPDGRRVDPLSSRVDPLVYLADPGKQVGREN